MDGMKFWHSQNFEAEKPFTGFSAIFRRPLAGDEI